MGAGARAAALQIRGVAQMSDRPIQVGDLVQIVFWPCCGVGLGAIFKVHGFMRASVTHVCICNAALPNSPFAFEDGPNNKRWGAPISWLKRIPPLDELEGQRTEESLKDREPA